MKFINTFIILTFVHTHTKANVDQVSQTEKTNINQYLQNVITNDLNLKINEQQLKIKANQYQSDRALFISEISGRTTKDADIQNSNISLLQKVGFGGAFNLSYNNLNTGKEHFVEYKQQLINNSFGYDDRIRIRRSKYLLDAEEILLENSKAELCQTASKKYMDTLALQQTLEISKQTMDDARSALNSVTRAYNRKLVTRNDYLSAKTDFLETKQNFIEMQANLELQKKTMSLLSKSDVYNLEEPSDITNFAMSDFKNQLKAFELQTKASKLEIKLLPSWKKPEVGLIIKAGQNTINQVDDNYIMVGMDLRWPVYNKKFSYAVSQAFSNYEIANLNLGLLKQNLEQQKLTIDTSLKNLKTKINTLEEVIKNSTEQLKLAFGKLRLGQIEFEAYLLIRNKLNREMIDLVNSNNQYFIEGLNKTIINNKLPSFCTLK